MKNRRNMCTESRYSIVNLGLGVMAVLTGLLVSIQISTCKADVLTGKPGFKTETSAPKHQFADVRDALQAAKNVSQADQMEILGHLSQYPVTSPDGVKALHSAMDDAEVEYKDEVQGKEAIQKSEYIASALSKCTGPQFHKVIADLLDKEVASLPNKYVGPLGTAGLNETYKASFQYRRLE